MAQPDAMRAASREEASPSEASSPRRRCSSSLIVSAARTGRDAAVLRGQVDEGLVGRRPLDAPARGEQHRRDLLADAAVGVEIAAPERRIRTEAPRLQERHPDAHAGRPGLLAGGRHEAHPGAVAADHDRPPAQGGIEAALDRDEERVEVDVQDEVASLLHETSLGPAPAGRGPLGVALGSPS